MKLDRIDVTGLDVPTRLPDLRRDIHVLVDYVRGRVVKRMHRSNTIGKADSQRLAKLMSDRDAMNDVDQEGSSEWIEYVSLVALRLGFVKYDTEGGYAGATSVEPTFPDNYMQFMDKPYQQFVHQDAAKQESSLLKVLVGSGQENQNEFYRPAVLGRLDRFSTWGSATGVMPTLDFAASRRFLLELLSGCPAGEWLSTASLVQYLKKNHQYFLIPRKPGYKHKWDASQGRYGNFHESKKQWGSGQTIAEKDKDSFERVEGRYVERFLEGIPLLLRYVDVAYVPDAAQKIYPSRGVLKGFRVSERLGRALREEISNPRVTVTPSFDIYVQAETYPAGVLAELEPLCDVVSEDTSIVLKMAKQKVAAARAADPNLDVVALLRRLSRTEVPANVARELTSWSEHGEKFVLWSDCCLLESDKDLEWAAPLTVESVTTGLRLVRSPDRLFGELEQRELMPLRVKHGDEMLSPLPPDARSCFPKTATARKKRRGPKTKITLRRKTRVQLICPHRDFLDRLQGILAEAKCPVGVDRETLALTYFKTNQPDVSNALRSLGTDYQIKIEDTE